MKPSRLLGFRTFSVILSSFLFIAVLSGCTDSSSPAEAGQNKPPVVEDGSSNTVEDQFSSIETDETPIDDPTEDEARTPAEKKKQQYVERLIAAHNKNTPRRVRSTPPVKPSTPPIKPPAKEKPDSESGKNTKPATPPSDQPKPSPTPSPNQPDRPKQPPSQPETPKPVPQPKPPSPAPDQGFKFNAWLPFWQQEKAIQAMEQHPSTLSSVNLFWYQLKADGQVGLMQYAEHNAKVISTAGKKGIDVMATVANTDDWADYDKGAQAFHQLIDTKADRAKLSDDLVKWVVQNKFAGIDINIEVIYGSDRENFSLFMEELSGKLHRQNKKLSVSVYPKTSEPGGWDGPMAQDWKRLGQAVDEFKIMAYNYSMPSPGPGAPLHWIDEITRFAKSQMPAHKVFIGLPSYGYLWSQEGRVSSLTYAKAMDLIKTNQAKVNRDPNGEPFFTYEKDGKKYTGYYQDSSSWQKKLELLKKNHPDIGGVTEWYLGSEDPAVWSELDKLK
ncbi:glycosyl hydrolase family 18 protein [Lihuaxuella thermophila]|uniref:Spore germination protein YaaH n=1 Tax=Lihuaxuella thermophila TaxID=1173111 RepID=A0A1H8IEP4_9BACL|nr:glycosyl hydrolase family 18 protein [Lihuaxuella thermophila]SEN66695.1 Spore germination protein YaaH [Lihuaxuella thermophila]